MPGTPRERARQQTVEEIIRIGRRHLGEVGAAALSLRAVARDLGVVSSAVYRYVKSRDELLTLLLVDAYNELGDEVDAALAALRPAGAAKDPGATGNAGEASGAEAGKAGEEFYALAWTVRHWGLREPARYGLLFGSPVPGYAAPAEQTIVPGTRVVVALIQIIDRAHRQGRLAPIESNASAGEMSPALRENLDGVRAEMGLEIPEPLMVRGVLIWAALFGAVSFEVFGQYGGNTFTIPEELFEQQLQVLAAIVGL